jgi:hypothetical protein
VADTVLVPIAANRGPRATWRCTTRDKDGHRCRFRRLHEGRCRAFGKSFGRIPAKRRPRGGS